MPDEDEFFQQLELEADIEREVKETVRRFKRFLAERGVNLDAPRPTDQRERAQVVAGVLRVQFLAASKLMHEEAARHLDLLEAREAMQKARMQALQVLWQENVWVEPWLSLVYREFPGGPVSPDELTQIMEQAAEQDHDVGEERNHTAALLSAYLEEAQYELEHNDELVILFLTACVCMDRMRQQSEPTSSVSRSAAWEHIQARASQPDHAAWRTILQEYFVA